MKKTLKRVRNVIILLVVILSAIVFFVKSPVLGTPVSYTYNWKVSEINLKAHIQELADNKVFRNMKNVKRLNEVSDYILEKLKSYGYEPQIYEFTVNGEVYKNVSVRLDGKGDRKLMVVGAHYDACFETPGADDNASGVAGLLELARLLKKDGGTLKGPVELVFYSLEEPPYFRSKDMGSYHHAKNLKEEISLMISIEMIGRFSDEAGSQHFPIPVLKYLYGDIGNFVAVIGRPQDWFAIRKVKSLMGGSQGLRIESFNAPPKYVPGVDFSDQLNYWSHGMNGVMVSDTAFLRNKDYHTLADTSDKLNYKKMAEVVNGLVWVVRGF